MATESPLSATTMSLPLLPLRDVVVFPHMVIPLFVGRPKSIKALDVAMDAGKHILLVAQKSAAKDDPTAEDLYPIGSVATVLQMLKLPDGTVKVLVEGTERASIGAVVDEGEYLSAGATSLPAGTGEAHEIEAMRRALLAQFDQYVKLNKKIPPEILTSMSGIDDGGRLADAIAAHLPLKLEQKQEILEMGEPGKRLEHLLLLLELERQVRGDRVGEPAALVDPGHGGQDLGRDLLVELHILVELREQRPAHRLDLVGLAFLPGQRHGLRRKVLALVDDADEARAARALDEHLHGTVGELQHLQHRRDAADRVQVLGRRIVLGGRLLRHQQDLLAGVHRDVERLDRLRPSDEQGDHHVREDDDVAQGEQRQHVRQGRRLVLSGHLGVLPGVPGGTGCTNDAGGRRRYQARPGWTRHPAGCGGQELAEATFGPSA